MLFNQFFALSALATLAAATAIPRNDSPPAGSTCCTTVTTASDPAAAGIIALLGIIIQDVNVGVGLNCSPITVIGSGNGCNNGGTSVQCTDNSHGNLISIGCVPITL